MIELKQNGSVEKWAKEIAENIGEQTPKSMLKASELAAGAIRREIFEKGFRAGTGKLARSFTATLLQRKPGQVSGGAFSDLVYARIQDEGGTIFPRRAKALAIPISGAARKLSQQGVGPRGMSGLRLIWKKGADRGYLVSSQGVQYALRKSVRIPGRNYIEGARLAVADDIVLLMEGDLAVVARKAKP